MSKVSVQYRTLTLCFGGPVHLDFFSLGQEARASGWNSGKKELKSRLKESIWFEHCQVFGEETDLMLVP